MPPTAVSRAMPGGRAQWSRDNGERPGRGPRPPAKWGPAVACARAVPTWLDIVSLARLIALDRSTLLRPLPFAIFLSVALIPPARRPRSFPPPSVLRPAARATSNCLRSVCVYDAFVCFRVFGCSLVFHVFFVFAVFMSFRLFGPIFFCCCFLARAAARIELMYLKGGGTNERTKAMRRQRYSLSYGSAYATP